jgi:glycosyltransferase involved in cell wall biosynthesis
MKQISVVIPVKDESEIIEENLNEIIAYLEANKYDFEILVVENGSIDDTYNKLIGVSRNDKRLKIFHLEQPMFGEAIRIGVLNANYDVVFLSIDLSMGIDFIGQCSKLLETYDFVNGSRYLIDSKIERFFFRRVLSNLNKIISDILFKSSATDYDSCKAFKNKVGEELFVLAQSKHNFLLTEIILLVENFNFSFVEVPIVHIEKRKSRFNITKLAYNQFSEILKYKYNSYFKPRW